MDIKTENWPASRSESRKVADLMPYARNSRTHSPEQVAQIAASIAEWGFTSPILVDERGMVLAGHGRLLAAKKMGLAEVPVIVALGWTDSQKRAYIIADNKLALNAGWDTGMLAAEFEALRFEGFNVDLTGFNADEINDLFTPKPVDRLTDEDNTPEVNERSVSAPGDVWLLGAHRVMCGCSERTG